MSSGFEAPQIWIVTRLQLRRHIRCPLKPERRDGAFKEIEAHAVTEETIGTATTS